MALPKIVLRALHKGFLATRPLTLGVRCALFDAQGRIFLVRHTYMTGWFMPGGGVEAGETAGEAMRREVREEGNIELQGEPALFNLYFNNQASRRDHVALFRSDSFVQSAPKVPDREIAEAGFFAPDALPEDATPATHRRLRELAGEVPASPYW
ncbi:NUDIX domain-containing protein [Antarcticirhabdus aurantiaca]|uniref:NUDIX domain-containing protein n=1 Tax=Antarcticirhabdus aurantiaca TaxID=2606717 RepID=A0ACD4NTI1_9HYPH|nr:NUDIX domain-containing protein [Antarcticirhabdus aurantiaca]WAJ30043.1 NUDIX domain-containing protein [Jeongeuplla avenae]